jgi:hypothetical protein
MFTAVLMMLMMMMIRDKLLIGCASSETSFTGPSSTLHLVQQYIANTPDTVETETHVYNSVSV